MTKSALAGTSRSLVSHFTSSTAFLRKYPANRNSSKPSGNGAVAAKGNMGSPPRKMATGMR